MMLATAAQAAEPTHAVSPQPPAPPPTRIGTDQKNGTILFIIKGKEQARIDATGLHVRGSIDYTAMLTDL